jgi:hypothetical protein
MNINPSHYPGFLYSLWEFLKVSIHNCMCFIKFIPSYSVYLLFYVTPFSNFNFICGFLWKNILRGKYDQSILCIHGNSRMETLNMYNLMYINKKFQCILIQEHAISDETGWRIMCFANAFQNQSFDMLVTVKYVVHRTFLNIKDIIP